MIKFFFLFIFFFLSLIFSNTAPDRPPVDVVVWTPHSTSIHVSWNEVPNGYKNGIIRGYKVHYTELQQNAPTGTENIPPFERSLSITGLRKFTQYNVTVLAYTSKGDGVTTSTVMMTDQDGMSYDNHKGRNTRCKIMSVSSCETNFFLIFFST